MKGRTRVIGVTFAAVLVTCASLAPARADLVAGSKSFPESWILAEALASLAREAGTRVDHRQNLGGTEIVFGALAAGKIDFYPDYTGTIREVILHDPSASTLPAMRAALAGRGIGISDPLGFNDGYAIAVTRATSERLSLRTIGDLAAQPDLKIAFTHEFLGRPDGYPGLAARYGLHMRDVRGIQHELAYPAIADGSVDAIDIYTTDAQIAALDLVLLEDDLGFFPRYDAVILYRLDLPERAPEAWQAMARLVGRIDEARMTRANAEVVLEGKPFAAAAESLLTESLGRSGRREVSGRGFGSLAANTTRHLELVAISLLAAILLGVPLGVLAAWRRGMAGPTLAAAGVLQTIPSLALLAFLIPLLGIGVVPALVALFLYSLLPIVRNTYVGLRGIPGPLAEAAEALGLSPSALWFRIRLPMASPAIMAGIKTSAVINVGTATLAALIGAGGLGDPILAGIQLRQNALILQGAVPAALLALLVQWAFDLLDRIVIPRGLRLPAERT
jgi:osmoprotectant transport system substrate-binding protein/osmoprotectant transport system permease protein